MYMGHKTPTGFADLVLLIIAEIDTNSASSHKLCVNDISLVANPVSVILGIFCCIIHS